MVKRWYADLKKKNGRTDTKDAERLGYPNSEVVPETMEKNPQTRFGRL